MQRGLQLLRTRARAHAGLLASPQFQEYQHAAKPSAGLVWVAAHVLPAHKSPATATWLKNEAEKAGKDLKNEAKKATNYAFGPSLH